MVNRLWQTYFGVGIVKTVEDFGSQGEWPTNPELLDWLATEFMRTGWDVKAIIKTIVTSATYRQSSSVSRELLQKDPDNRLLTRGPRFRLPAEAVRDQAWHVGCAEAPRNRPTGLDDRGERNPQGAEPVAKTRRSLHTFWKRAVARGMMFAWP
jgi:hypothetical protein